ncbi:unnamed protein product [Closterium sp. NIES-53]
MLDDGLGSAGWRDETRGGEGVAAAAARVTDGRAEGGAGEEEADGQGGQVVTGGATAGTSHARGNAGRRSSAIGSSRSSGRGSRRWRQVLRVLRWVQRRAVRGAAAAYPWVQAPYEACVTRAVSQELAMQAALLKALYYTMDYAQTSVIAAVFAFKMAEWWYQTGEQKLSAPTVYPPPPAPPPPKASLCPLIAPCVRSACAAAPTPPPLPPWASSSATPASLPTWISSPVWSLPHHPPPHHCGPTQAPLPRCIILYTTGR